MIVEVLTGRRGDVDRLIDVGWFSWTTLVAGCNAEQVLLTLHHVGHRVLQVQNVHGHLEEPNRNIFMLLLSKFEYKHLHVTVVLM